MCPRTPQIADCVDNLYRLPPGRQMRSWELLQGVRPTVRAACAARGICSTHEIFGGRIGVRCRFLARCAVLAGCTAEKDQCQKRTDPFRCG